MSKPIKLTDELVEKTVEDFRQKLKSQKMIEGGIHYSKQFVYDSETMKAKIIFEPMAFAKMVSLLMKVDNEVGWYGVCKRSEDDDSKFVISDILVYPQEVTAATVQMDELEFSKWLVENGDDERFYNMFAHGHSHVKMSTNPSVTDLTHQEEALAQQNEGFLIFMIWNKYFAHTTVIYDLDNNILYEDDDIEYDVSDGKELMSDFLKGAEKLVKQKVYNKTTSTVNLNQSKNFYTGGADTKSKAKGLSNTTGSATNWNGRGKSSMDPKAKPYTYNMLYGNSYSNNYGYDSYGDDYSYGNDIYGWDD